jgi:hypothetical protein
MRWKQGMQSNLPLKSTARELSTGWLHWQHAT